MIKTLTQTKTLVSTISYYEILPELFQSGLKQYRFREWVEQEVNFHKTYFILETVRGSDVVDINSKSIVVKSKNGDLTVLTQEEFKNIDVFTIFNQHTYALK